MNNNDFPPYTTLPWPDTSEANTTVMSSEIGVSIPLTIIRINIIQSGEMNGVADLKINITHKNSFKNSPYDNYTLLYEIIQLIIHAFQPSIALLFQQ